MTQSDNPGLGAETGEEAVKRRRRYHSPLREQQAAQTRKKLITAGVKLVQELPDWDWRHLTFKAVAKRAGVSERTVYRHFASERQLRDSVMEDLVSASGVELEQLELDNFSDATNKIFTVLSTFALTPATVKDPTLASMDEKRRVALRAAVSRVTPDWTEEERDMVAASMDILWDVPSYERLLAAWSFEPQQAARTIQWLIRLVQESVRRGDRP